VTGTTLIYVYTSFVTNDNACVPVAVGCCNKDLNWGSSDSQKRCTRHLSTKTTKDQSQYMFIFDEFHSSSASYLFYALLLRLEGLFRVKRWTFVTGFQRLYSYSRFVLFSEIIVFVEASPFTACVEIRRCSPFLLFSASLFRESEGISCKKLVTVFQHRPNYHRSNSSIIICHLQWNSNSWGNYQPHLSHWTIIIAVSLLQRYA
jgi:hypothetical protein